MAKKSKIKKLVEADEREKRKDDGFYDGRFRTKVVPSKRKYKRKRKAEKIDHEEEKQEL